MKLFKITEKDTTFNITGTIKIMQRQDGLWLSAKKPTTCEQIEPAIIERYTCTCDPSRASEHGDKYVYPRQVVMDLPDWTEDHQRRRAKGYPANVCVDGCIVDAIKELWDKAIDTTGCCCGHNIMPAWVSVIAEDYYRMFELGYHQKPVDVVNGHPMGLYTFYL
jgi:hypothetical protein